jgi:hypothetical protein
MDLDFISHFVKEFDAGERACGKEIHNVKLSRKIMFFRLKTGEKFADMFIYN